MEFRVLRYFLTVAREGIITEADFLYITQPMWYRQSKDFKRELGKEQFIRSSHSIILIDEGILLRKREEAIADMMDKLEDQSKK